MVNEQLKQSIIQSLSDTGKAKLNNFLMSVGGPESGDSYVLLKEFINTLSAVIEVAAPFEDHLTFVTILNGIEKIAQMAKEDKVNKEPPKQEPKKYITAVVPRVPPVFHPMASASGQPKAKRGRKPKMM